MRRSTRPSRRFAKYGYDLSPGYECHCQNALWETHQSRTEMFLCKENSILPDRDDEVFVKVLNSPELKGQKVTLVTDNKKDFQNAKNINMIAFQAFTAIIRKLR